MRIEGLDCGACAIKIEGALKRLTGVTDIQVSYATGTLSLRLDEGRTSRETVDSAAGRTDGHSSRRTFRFWRSHDVEVMKLQCPVRRDGIEVDVSELAAAVHLQGDRRAPTLRQTMLL